MSGIHLLQVTEDHSVSNAGITSLVDAVIRQVASKPAAFQQTMICTGDDPIALPDEVSLTCLPPSKLGRPWRHPPGANRSLVRAVRNADVIHMYGIWMWLQWAAARAAHQLDKPFIISVCGMLEPFIWARQPWPHQAKKSLYWFLMAYPAFRHASVVHAIHSAEAQTIRKYFKLFHSHKDQPGIEVIPLSLDLDSVDRLIKEIDPSDQVDQPNHAQHFSTSHQDRYILFLGRLHPVKGVDLLIRAFSHLAEPGVKLKIAGFSQPREAAYEAYLHQIVDEAGLNGKVEFLGAVYGPQKWELLRNAWVFCLPSHSEAIGTVNLEAAACSTPVITTHITGVGSDWVENGGILIEPEIVQLEVALNQALQWSIQERVERGYSMRRLIDSTFSWKATAERWYSVYERLGARS